MVKMIARKTLRYGTRRLVADDQFDATRADARVLTALRMAVPHVEPAAPVEPAEPADPADPRDHLRERAAALGIKVDARWGTQRLAEEIERASGGAADGG